MRSPSGSLISVYVDRPSPGGMTALLTDLLKPVKEGAEIRGRSVQKSVRADAERIHRQADQLEAEAAPGYAIFASSVDDIFLVESLTHAVSSISSLGPRPYLRPLRAAPRAWRAGVLVADKTRARVFVVSGDLVEEIDRPLAADIGKPNYGGFAGYDEHVVRSRADDASLKMWREAGALLLERHLERPFDFLSIGGHEETIEEVGRTLHPYLDRLHRSSFVANPQSTSTSSIRVTLREQAEQMRRERHTAVAGRVCDTAWSDGLAVLGLSPALAACNAQAVDTLVVAGEFTLPGAICNECGFLARSGETCPVCGSAMFEVEDIVAAAMESVVATGGKVYQLIVPSPLDSHGVGALIRFPIPL
jgi:peptide chain release factor subunit 1